MEKKINSKYKNNYKDGYDVLYEAVFSERSHEDTNKPLCSEKISAEILCNHHGPNLRSQKEDIEMEDYEESSWSQLPDILLENVFTYLTIEQRYYSSMVCRSWNRGFYLPNSWKTFIFNDTTLTRKRFNYYSGWQYMLDEHRTEMCLKRIGSHIRALVLKPITNFYNLYKFMGMFSYYAEQKNSHNCMLKDIGSRISSLQYTFPCNMSNKNETRLYGTGGRLLYELKRLMGNLPSLKDLRLFDLMLDSNEALQLLDEICYSHCLAMRKLVLINISKTQCPLLHIGVFLNLQELVISPQCLGDDVIGLIADTKLRNLHIVQNSYTPTDDVIPVSWRTWKMCRERNVELQVHLHVQSRKNQSLIWQEFAPVHTILIDSPHIRVNADLIAQAVDGYKKTLHVFGHMSLPRYYEPKSFHERLDSHLLYLCYNCTRLNTLIVTEKISTATVLLIAFFAKNLKLFHLRKNGVILRSDWPQNPDWSDDLHNWVKQASRSYKSTETEVSSILGYKWKMLSDKEFRLLKLDVQIW